MSKFWEDSCAANPVLGCPLSDMIRENYQVGGPP